MRRLATITTLALIVATVSAVAAVAQNSVSSARPPLPATDSIYRRARRLVTEGDGASGRAIVDSMLRAAVEGTPGYGDALFWRGALSETAADAERDYRRVIVEYPLSPYADDALLSLAELEQARGDRTAAYQHLQRFVREHAPGPARARAGLAAGRLAFEQRDVTRGCAMIADARQSVGTSDVELRNQIDYHGARCPASSPATVAAPPTGAPSGSGTVGSGVRPSTSTSSAPAPTVVASPPSSAPPTSSATSGRPPATTDSSRPDSGAARPTVATSGSRSEPAAKDAAKEPAPRGIWTIQLAAYNTRPDAEALVRKLAARGVKARISGDAKPFRVRLDYYQTRQDAAARVAELKERGIIGFVTDEPRSAGGARP